MHRKVDHMKDNIILLDHGGGGLLSHELVTRTFLPSFRNSYLERMEDGAVFDIEGKKLCFSTDSYVVKPIFFPGGDIGSLAVHGTVNDLSMCGGTPLFLSAGFILEEGFPMEQLERVIASMAQAAAKANVQIVTGDTKVVARGAADGLYINTTGIGVIRYEGAISVGSIAPGDAIIVNGTIGDHGAAILSKREELGLDTEILSDSAPLNGLVENILQASPHIHAMRDATRGGLGSILAEIADQSHCQIILEEQAIPVKETVRGVCEILGFDPLFLANEGKMVVFCSPADARKVLHTMKAHPYGADASIIGRVDNKGTGRLILHTLVGGSRVIDLPAGELVPRIC
jgi:hydrogenase expression/formation protein HypE